MHGLQVPFALYDAFSEVPFGGSQACIISDAGAIPRDLRIAIAKELGMPATAFVDDVSPSSVTAQFFSTVMEQPMCGHGTVCLFTRLVGPVPDFQVPSHWSRKSLRSIGRVDQMSVAASELALEQAGLIDDPLLESGDMGVAYGSSAGSTTAIGDFGKMLLNKSTEGLNATSYIRMMSHTAVVNTGLFFNIRGRLISTSTACTSGSQAIGYAYEAIKYGKQKVMVAGGAEELSATQAAVFDVLFATSVRNDEPDLTPRPFDKDRDGLVIGEGAATLILEDLEHADKRVIVIGSGATAVTLVPALATGPGAAAHVTMLQRSPTYMIAFPDEDIIANVLRRILPERLAYRVTRWKNIRLQTFIFRIARKRPRFARWILVGHARRVLGHLVGFCRSPRQVATLAASDDFVAARQRPPQQLVRRYGFRY